LPININTRSLGVAFGILAEEKHAVLQALLLTAHSYTLSRTVHNSHHDFVVAVSTTAAGRERPPRIWRFACTI